MLAGIRLKSAGDARVGRLNVINNIDGSPAAPVFRLPVVEDLQGRPSTAHFQRRNLK